MSKNIRGPGFLAFTMAAALVCASGRGDAAQSGVVSDPVVAPAASAAPEAAATKPAAPAIKVPPEVVQAVGADTPQGRNAIRRFLLGDRLQAQAVQARALALVQALKQSPAGQDPQQLLALSNRVAEVAKQIFQNASITRVTVDKSYVPGPGTKAWKFGPADAEVPRGFEQVTPQDPRLKGVEMRAVHRPGDDPITSSGIMGVRNFNSELRNGDWRVILLTDDLGEPQTDFAPFGQAVNVNSTQVNLLEADPNEWLDHAYLTNRTIKGSTATPAESRATMGVKDGVVTHQAKPPGGGPDGNANGPVPSDEVASTTAGGLLMQAPVRDGVLNVGFAPPPRPDQTTFVVAIIAEPTTQPPAFKQDLSPLDIEAKIFDQALRLTPAPQAGQPVTATQQPAVVQGGPPSSPKPIDVITPPNTPSASPT